jgi:uncharacterized protein YciI
MFAVTCKDKPGHLQTRLDNRAAHLEHLKAHAAHLVLAGPLFDEARETMIGSLLVVDLPDRAALDAFLAADPYAQAGLFDSVTVAPFRKVLP